MARKFDVDEVTKAFEAGESGRSIARRLGVHQNTIYAFTREISLKCIRCHTAVARGQKLCPPCREYDAKRMRDRRRERSLLGTCVQCDLPRANASKYYCETHRLEHVERMRRSYADGKKKRGAPEGGVMSQEQKRQSIIAKYGHGGWTAWQEADGKCETCRRPYEETAIHIHHIDCNDRHNERSNFAVLCFRCHRATHLLLESASRKRFVEWFSRTYPDKPLR